MSFNKQLQLLIFQAQHNVVHYTCAYLIGFQQYFQTARLLPQVTNDFQHVWKFCIYVLEC